MLAVEIRQNLFPNFRILFIYLCKKNGVGDE